MGGSLPPFADQRTLDLEVPVPVLITKIFTFLDVHFSVPIAYGDTSDLTAWDLGIVTFPQRIVSIQVLSGFLRFNLFNSSPVNELTFRGPPPVFRGTNRAVMEPFFTPVPLP